MTVTTAEIAKAFPDDIVDVIGESSRVLSGVRPLSNPGAGMLAFIKPAFPNIDRIGVSLAGMAVVCSAGHAKVLAGSGVTCLVAVNPRLSFLRIVARYFPADSQPLGVHRTAVVDPSAQIDPSAAVGAHCSIGANCKVGAGSVLHANVTLYAGVRIGADVVVHSGTVVGADGFGYERNAEGALEKFPHVGGVVIEDDVEIGSNTSIDRGTLGDTVIGTGTRIDNQCHISHNVRIGRHVAVIAQSMIGGSCVIGDYAWLAPAALIFNQVRVGARATVGLGAVVTKDVPDGETVVGSPAVPLAEFRAQRAALKAPKG